MRSAEIRSRFLRFFEERGHTVVPSASLIAADPTLLLVNAGMQPFKPYFLGDAAPPYPRAVSVQKCVRTLDIDEVGRTTRHASFFQMCGNFSFGDYFKERAIPLAWELLTTPVAEGGFGFDPQRMWVTVYLDDDEAFDIWHDVVGVPAERIQRRGMADNYWSMGVPGPCGPCSEIYFDRGPEYGAEGGPVVDEERYLEVWNLVFMQFVRGEGKGKEDFPILGPLPAPSIDTGLGLERMAAILQGVDNIYEIDTTRHILDAASALSGRRYHDNPQDDVRLRVVADHARTAVMLIGDGVTPGNEGRGYVLRRIMRRTVRAMRLLGAHGRVFGRLVEAAVEAMGEQYPELVAEAARIHAVAEAEESAFVQTLRTGTTILDTAVADARTAGAAQLSGDVAFRLHDTYGFPIDLTLEMAAEQGLQVDEDGFRRLMKEQRERAKADARAKKTGHADVSVYRALADAAGPSQFTGYERVAGEGVVRGLAVDGVVAAAAGAGAEVEVVLDRTPFYAEGGGQLADEGLLRLANGAVLEVVDVQTPVPGLVVHRARVVDGEVEVGQQAEAFVDVERRRAISRAHTATHMVHRAFREALGETATQMGSENSPGRLRFDFPNPSAVPPTVLSDVEQRVNAVLVDDLPVTAQVMSQDEARALGAMALFGEKYGERVRVVSVGDWARELCGGTHMQRTGQLGVVKLLGESSIGAGVRRVEALVGADAYRFLAREHLLVSQLAETLKTPRDQLPARVEDLVARLRNAERDIERMRSAELIARVGDLLGVGEDIGPVRAWVFRAPDGVTAADLRKLVEAGRGRVRVSGLVALAVAVADGRVSLIAYADPAAVALGLTARDLLQVAAPHVAGRGGGKDDFAQGGGTEPAGVQAALDAALAHVRTTVAG
ncbi:MAG: alanine--tRNA ligase [Actinomycetia bacterium]|nr:alanine--tRNA ligase [Actinomycetes bacterium]